MDDLFDSVYGDLKKYRGLLREMERRSDSLDVAVISGLQAQTKSYKERFKMVYEVYLVVVVIGFYLAMLVNEVYNLPICSECFLLMFLVFINLTAFFLLLNETMKLVNMYEYNKGLIFAALLAMPFVNGVYSTLRSGEGLRWYDFFDAGYLVVGLMFVGFMAVTMRLYDSGAEIFGYGAPRSKVDSVSFL